MLKLVKNFWGCGDGHSVLANNEGMNSGGQKGSVRS